MTSSGDGHDTSDDPLGKKSNVVQLKVPRSKKASSSSSFDKKPVKVTVKSNSNHTQFSEPHTRSEPLINLPPYTKYMLGLLISIHLIIVFILNDTQANWIFTRLGLTPGSFTGNAAFEPIMLLSPVTHMLLHGSWLHITMNAVMLLAFGSGVERWIGGRKMLLFFVLCGLCGVITHFALNHTSGFPVIGASGGLSGLFALALTMMNRQNIGMSGKYGIWPFIILWVGISVLFGFMGSPDGGQIAWAAHVGGFLGGFAVIKLMRI